MLKPDPFDVALWGIILAAIVGVIYYSQLRAMLESNRINRDAMEIGSRGYINIGKIDIYCPICKPPLHIPPPERFPAEANASVYVSVFNTGKTPVYSLEMNVTTWERIGEKIPKGFDYKEMVDENVTSPFLPADPSKPGIIALPFRAESILNARGQVPVYLGRKITPEYLYLYGHVSYTDIFHVRRTMLFCEQFIPGTQATPEYWILCNEHNGEDDTYRPKQVQRTPGFASPQLYPPEFVPQGGSPQAPPVQLEPQREQGKPN